MSASIYFQSGQVVLDNNGKVAPGAKLYFFDASSTTPRTTYSDADLTSQRTHPVVADGNGRIPVIYLAYGSFDVRLTTSGGTQLFYQTDIANPAPFDDTTTFDTTTVLTTGDIFPGLANSTRTGAVRLNGRTLGNVTSSATERANDDTINLFAYIWNGLADAQAAVSGGRGASAAADFAASKRITIPDYRGCSLVGYDDMGNTAASLLGSAPVVSGGPTTAGSILGANTHTLTTAQLASHTHAITAQTTGTESADHTHGVSITSATENQPHTHTGTSGTESADHTHGVTAGTQLTQVFGGGGTVYTALTSSGGTITSSGKSATHTHTTTTGDPSQTHTHLVSGNTGVKSATHTHSLTGATDTNGSGTAHNNVGRAGLVTWFIKL